MRRVIIVDDETIVRVTLRSLLDWEAYGFQIQADFSNGRSALEYFETNTADLLITDMKMPDVDGITLMEQLRGRDKLPVTVVLSGYHEFELVRKAFLVGAFDYLLKSDLTIASLDILLRALNEKAFRHHPLQGGQAAAASVMTSLEEFQNHDCGVVLFEAEDKQEYRSRFGRDLKEMLQKPVLELARQLPRVASRGQIDALDPFQYVLLYQVGDSGQYHQNILSVTRQLQSVWQDYLNLTCKAAVSEIIKGSAAATALRRNRELLKLADLKQKPAICTQWQDYRLITLAMAREGEWQALVSCLSAGDELGVSKAKKAFFQQLYSRELSTAISECLGLILLLSMKFRDYQDELRAVFPEQVDYQEKLGRLSNLRELELWMNNYFSWIINYIQNRHDSKQLDLMLRAKRFLADNYGSTELTLKTAADFVGLNEKYFSSRFKKETGVTFSAYLIHVRMERAKELMDTTDLKIYEISARVGYYSVEHFNRLFKRTFGQSPGSYRKRSDD